jgi:DNA-binding PadR family transcriptional regulator
MRPGAEKDTAPVTCASSEQEAVCSAAIEEATGEDFEDCPCTGRNLDKFTAPAALLAIAEAGQISGYAIAARVQSLTLSGDSGVDHSGVYRSLRKMEASGMVASLWEAGDKGPARRLYTLTDSGRRCLDRWAMTLRSHSRAIEGFLREYGAVQSSKG